MFGVPKLFSKSAKISLLFLLFLNTCFANSIPTAEDVNRLAEMANLTVNAFMQESFEPRVRYQCLGRFFSTDDKEKLQKTAKRAGEHLEQIIKDQEIIKQRIEEYQADDWDQRYGQTGLWRKISGAVFYTSLNSHRARFYQLLSQQNERIDDKLKQLLVDIEQLCQNFRRPGPLILKAEILTYLSQTEPSYKQAAIKEYDKFQIFSDVYGPVKAQLGLMKLTSNFDTEKFSWTFSILQQNRSKRYTELVVELAFLQSHYDPNGFEQTVRFFPQIKDFLGSLILFELTGQQQPTEDLSVLKAQLAGY